MAALPTRHCVLAVINIAYGMRHAACSITDHPGSLLLGASVSTLHFQWIRGKNEAITLENGRAFRFFHAKKLLTSAIYL